MVVMKRMFIFLLLPYCIFFNDFKLNEAHAKAETSTYAKAIAGCTLYKTQSLKNEISNIYFIIPETYFVIVLDKISDECYKVQYDKFIGYIKASTAIIATFIPIIKTLENITVDIKDSSGTQVWSQPNTNSNILTTISAGFKNIKYIASCYGTIPSGGESNLWYYVNYTPSANSTNVYEGYIYSENTINLSEIIANAEVNPEVISNDNIGNILYLSSSLKTVIIAIITIPIIIFLLIILYKSSKKIKDFTNKQNIHQAEQDKPIFNSFNLNNYENQSNNLQQNQNYNGQPQNNFNNNPLKSSLSKMKNLTFFKKNNNSNNNFSYPSFPDYNEDDDML